MFHKYHFVEVERFYAPPAAPGTRLKGSIYEKERARMMHGETTIVYRCNECGWIRKEEMIGKKIS